MLYINSAIRVPSKLASLTYLGLAAVAGHAQTCENTSTRTLPSTSGVKYVCTGGLLCYDPSGDTSWDIDRRPAYFLSLFCGNNCRDCDDDNPLGQSAYWATPNWTNFEQRLDDAWDAGFRRFVLYNPGGNLPGFAMGQTSYWHLTEGTGGQQDLLENDLADWIADRLDDDETLEFGIVIGSWQSGSPRTPCRNTAAGGGYWDCASEETKYGITIGDTFFDPTDLDSMKETYQNFKPWMDIGCNTFWLDNSSNPDPVGSSYSGPERLVDLRMSPNYSAIKIAGEAIPWVQDTMDPDYGLIDSSFDQSAAWYAKYSFVRQRGWLVGSGTYEQFPNPSTTELCIMFGNPDPAGTDDDYTIYTVASARDHGFVPWTDREPNFGFIQRLYDGDNNEFYSDFVINGDFTDFDFNGTGGTEADYCAFLTNWKNNFGTSDPDYAYWDGDIDNDDDVDCTDLAIFNALTTWPSVTCTQTFCP